MKVLFITRKFPPSIGGMQTLSYQLARELSRKADVSLLTWGRSQVFLPYFLAASFLRAIRILRSGRAEHVHLGDGLLAPLGVALRSLTGATVSVTVNGRDIAYDFTPYQLVIPRALSRLDKVVCVSEAIARECIARGVPSEKCVVVPNGVYPSEFRVSVGREELTRILGRDVRDRKLLITVGRLVRKKGVAWFVANVLPRLSDDVLYVIVGEGPERSAIEEAARVTGVAERVFLLGAIARDDRRLKVMYGAADAFVMPNVRVRGDMEGFGIVALEAASAGLPVIASRVEGVQDAVIEGETGRLVESESADAFVAAIGELLDGSSWSKDRVRGAVERVFSWEGVGTRYLQEMESARAGVAPRRSRLGAG